MVIRKLFLIFLILLSVVFVYAQLPDDADNRIDFSYVVDINYSLVPTVNATQWWITDEGNMDNVPDLYPTLDLRYLELDGSNFGFSSDFLSYANPNFDFNDVKLNNTILDLTKTIFYNASSVEIIVGTLADGGLNEINSYNGLPYSLDEDASDIDLRVNFTIGVDNDYNNLIIRYKSTEEDLAHTMQVQIYEPEDGDWEDYGTLPGSAVYTILQFGIFDSDEHMNELGVVQVRFFQDEGVPPKTHQHDFDWVSISKGFGTPSGEEADPLSIHKDGDIIPTGDFDWGQFMISNLRTITINSSDGDNIIGQDAFPNRVATTDANGIKLSDTGWLNAGLFTEVDGEILSYGINVPQIGDRDNTAVGGIFRLDTRASKQKFTIFGYPTGGSTAYERLRISLQNGLSDFLGNNVTGVSQFGNLSNRIAKGWFVDLNLNETINMNAGNITKVTKTTFSGNESYGTWSNGTTTWFGYVGDL